MQRMQLWFMVLTAVLLLGGGCSRPEDYVAKGKKAADQGKFAEASLNFRKAIQKNPQYGEAFRELAHSQIGLGDLTGAAASLERALELKPDDEALRSELADTALAIYSADPRRPKVWYDRVTKLSQEMLAKDPKSFNGLRFEGSLLYSDNRLPEAIEVLRKANTVKPMMPGIVLTLADALLKNGQAEEAEGLAVALIAQHKDFLPIYDWLAILYESTNRPRQAEAVRVQKAANNPKDRLSILQLAAYYQQTNRPTERVAVLNRLIENPKDFPDRFLRLGDFYGGMRLWEDARQWLETGIKEDPKNAEVYQRRLVAVYRGEQKRTEALNLLNQLIQASPNDVAMRAQRAELWIAGKDQQEIAKAIDECQALIKAQPRDPRLKFLLGQAYFAKGDRESAGKAFAQAAAQQRLYLEPRIALANLDRDTRNYKETVRLADEILAVDPNNFSGRLLHASGSRGLGNLDIAQRELEVLAREAPQSGDVQLEMGLVILARKQYAVAERMFAGLYQSNQADVRALAGLASVYLAEGKGDLAIQTVTGEVNRLPNSLEVRELLAAVALNSGKLDVALEQYQKLTAMAPDNAKYYVSLADLFREKSDYKNEVTALEKASKLAPENATVEGRLAMAEELNGNKREAADASKKSVEMEPANAALLNNRAYFIAEDGGNLDEALQYSQTALRQFPGDPNVLDTLAWVYTKRKMNDSAIQILDKLVKDNPNVAAWHYHLGTALAQKGDKNKAKAELAVALTKRPTPEEEGKIKDLMGKLQ